MAKDNAARRLYVLLENAMTIPSEQLCRTAWVDLLGTTDSALLMARLGKVMGLPAIVLEEIEEHHPGMGIHHSHWVAQLSTAFGQQNLDGQWATFKGHIKSQTISYVAIAATSLDGRTPSPQLNLEGLSTLKDQVDDLATAILEAELSEDIRRYLIRQVQRMRDAIDEYWISGGEPIIELVEATFGHLGTNQACREAIKTPTGQKIAEALAVLADGITVASGLPPLMIGVGLPLLEWAKELTK